MEVAIHNKNGQGLLLLGNLLRLLVLLASQSTIKMDKGYYIRYKKSVIREIRLSQSTIKMDKGYYSLLHC